MTKREAQLFEWIKENPMISQEELAERAGIKRSSVAVHISNLMKKGLIQGKGYITNNPGYCTVIGGVNLDIGGRPDAELIQSDSNPGRISYSLGGVGRNIAHNMALLGLDVKLITALGEDNNAVLIRDSCHNLGIDISLSISTSEENTSTYLFIADQGGDMSVAISDMNIYRHLTPEVIAARMDVINNSKLVIIDTNIPVETIEYIVNNCTVPVYADPVSTTKAKKLESVIGKLHTITPNVLEAEILSGIKIDSEEELEKAAAKLLDKGLKQVFITRGADGLYASNKEETYVLPNLKCKLVNATGAGDAMMAGFAYAESEGYSLKEKGMIGLGAASLAIEGVNTINDQMNSDEVLKRAGIE